MDMIETTLDASGDKGCDIDEDKVALAQRLAIVEDDGGVRDSVSPILTQSGFTLRQDQEHGGAVSYRVVQFGSDGNVEEVPQGGIQSTVPSLLASSQMNGSPTDSTETRLALISSGDIPADGNSTVVVSGGQFYVISDVLTNSTPRSLAPRTTETVINQGLRGSTREEKRRVTHNEVERRRRDKINTWICRLAKIIPDCPEAHAKSAQPLEKTEPSKGGILAKACDYITELRVQNEQLLERLKDSQRRDMDYELLKQEVEVLKSENAALKNENAVRSQLQQQGLLGDLPP